jgi:hypothetical protein
MKQYSSSMIHLVVVFMILLVLTIANLQSKLRTKRMILPETRLDSVDARIVYFSESEVSPKFLNCCRLSSCTIMILTCWHLSTDTQLLGSHAACFGASQSVSIWQPTEHVHRRDVLGSLHLSSSVQSLLHIQSLTSGISVASK